MDRRALRLGGFLPGDRVSVPRGLPKGGREIGTFVAMLQRQKDPLLPECWVMVRGRKRKYPLWRVRLFIDNEMREKIRKELEELDADDSV